MVWHHVKPSAIHTFGAACALAGLFQENFFRPFPHYLWVLALSSFLAALAFRLRLERPKPSGHGVFSFFPRTRTTVLLLLGLLSAVSYYFLITSSARPLMNMAKQLIIAAVAIATAKKHRISLRRGTALVLCFVGFGVLRTTPLWGVGPACLLLFLFIPSTIAFLVLARKYVSSNESLLCTLYALFAAGCTVVALLTDHAPRVFADIVVYHKVSVFQILIMIGSVTTALYTAPRVLRKRTAATLSLTSNCTDVAVFVADWMANPLHRTLPYMVRAYYGTCVGIIALAMWLVPSAVFSYVSRIIDGVVARCMLYTKMLVSESVITGTTRNKKKIVVLCFLVCFFIGRFSVPSGASSSWQSLTGNLAASVKSTSGFYFDPHALTTNAEAYRLRLWKAADYDRWHLVSEPNFAYKGGLPWEGGEIASAVQRPPPSISAPRSVLDAIESDERTAEDAGVWVNGTYLFIRSRRSLPDKYVRLGGGVRPPMLPQPPSNWTGVETAPTCLGEPCIVLPDAIRRAKEAGPLDPSANRTAVVTTLFGTNDKWVWPLAVWAKAWSTVGLPGADVIVLVTPEVAPETRYLLSKYRMKVVEVEPFDTGRWPDFKERFDHTRWTGIYCRVLAHDIVRDLGYHYMVFADADALPLYDTSHVLKMIETRDNPARWMAHVRANHRHDAPLWSVFNNGLAFYQIQPRFNFTLQFEWWVDDIVRSVGIDVLPRGITKSEQEIYSFMFHTNTLYLPLSYNYRGVVENGFHAPRSVIESGLSRSELIAAGQPGYWTNLPPQVYHFNAKLKPWLSDKDYMRESRRYCTENGIDELIARWRGLGAHEFYGSISWDEYTCIWGEISAELYDEFTENGDKAVADAIIKKLWRFQF